MKSQLTDMAQLALDSARRCDRLYREAPPGRAASIKKRELEEAIRRLYYTLAAES